MASKASQDWGRDKSEQSKSEQSRRYAPFSKRRKVLSLRHALRACHLPRQGEERGQLTFGCAVRQKFVENQRSGGLPRPPKGGWFTKLFPAVQILKISSYPLPPLTRGLDWRVRRAKTGGEINQNKAGVTRRFPNGEKSEQSRRYAPFSKRRKVLSLRHALRACHLPRQGGRNGDS